jgi:hypothetical protein
VILGLAFVGLALRGQRQGRLSRRGLFLDEFDPRRTGLAAVIGDCGRGCLIRAKPGGGEAEQVPLGAGVRRHDPHDDGADLPRLIQFNQLNYNEKQRSAPLNS